MLNSYYLPLCPVALPFKGRRHYMHTFDVANPKMRAGYEDYLEPVLMLLRACGLFEGVAHMTVDEKVVPAGRSQRRPGPHVDGCFRPELNNWDHGPGWLHYCNFLPIERMSVIVAGSVEGCRAWRGQFDAQPKNDGDLSHLKLPEGEVLKANYGYWLSPDCVHESLIFSQETKRTFLRIALPTNFSQGSKH